MGCSKCKIWGLFTGFHDNVTLISPFQDFTHAVLPATVYTHSLVCCLSHRLKCELQEGQDLGQYRQFCVPSATAHLLLHLTLQQCQGQESSDKEAGVDT